MLTLHSREHRFLFGYLLLATVLLAGLAGWILCRNQNFQSENVDSLSSKLKRQDQLFKDQQEALPQLDSAYQAVMDYKPKEQAVFVEADIENQLNDIRQLYVQQRRTKDEANDTVRFFRAFDQVANFYKMLYQDKKNLAAQQANVQLLAGQLAECTIDYHAKGAAAQTVPATAALPPAASPATPPSAPH